MLRFFGNAGFLKYSSPRISGLPVPKRVLGRPYSFKSDNNDNDDNNDNGDGNSNSASKDESNNINDKSNGDNNNSSSSSTGSNGNSRKKRRSGNGKIRQNAPYRTNDKAQDLPREEEGIKELSMPNYQEFASEILKGKDDAKSKQPTNAGWATEESNPKAKKSLLVPHVPNTDYIPHSEIQTEGLFAGYKPLFLGNSSLDEKRADVLDGLFTSLTKIKKGTSAPNGEINVQEILDDLQKDDTMETLKEKSHKKPVIPWDASISGMVYNDQPFKDVPRNVVGKLKPFKLLRIERRNKKDGKSDGMIKMKVHNPKIDDEPEVVDLLHENQRNKFNQKFGTTDTDVVIDSRKKYEIEKVNYAHKHKFIKSDQHIFKTDVDKLNRFLAKEFYKLTKLTLYSEFKDYHLPLYIYVDKSISSKRIFQSFLRKRILNNITPLLTTICSSYPTEEQAEKFKSRVLIKIDTIVKDLSEYLPSVYFTGDVVDCILHPSPIPGFGRIHWLKPTKRHNVFWGKNIDSDFVFNLNKEYKVTRSGVRYMSYPINLHWKTFDAAFTEWDYFT